MQSITKEKFEDIKEWYNSIVDSYEILYGKEQEEKTEYIINLMKKLFDSKLFENGLDFGCGTGISTRIIYEFSKNKYAYDLSENMIKKLLEKYENINIINNLYEEKDKYHNFFDLITAITVLQDMDDNYIEDTLNLFNEILKDEGILIISVLKRGRDISFWKNILKKYFKILWFDNIENDYLFILSKKFL